MKQITTTLFLIFAMIGFGQTCLADSYITVQATALRLQNYTPDVLAIWYSGSTCNSGSLSAANLSEADKNRLYSTVLAAKLANHTVFFYYTPGNSCAITSFGMDN